MAEHLKLIRTVPAKPAPGGFINTTAATEILYTLGRVHAEYGGGAMGPISGAPGVGKSKALMEFKQSKPNVVLVKAVQGEGGTWNLANELCRALNITPPKGRNLADDRRRLADAFGVDCLLMIDEAQYLVKQNPKGRDDWEAFEWLRGMCEEGCMSVVFCGDLRLRELSQVAPPLWRRLRRCIILGTTRDDVDAIAGQWGIEDGKARDLLFMVARKGGGALADVALVCREAQVMAGGNPVAFDHVAAAVQDLQILGAK